ncbi:MAG TPA: hypothetical protein VIL36_00345 [Acidimicrobiales bacterium]
MTRRTQRWWHGVEAELPGDTGDLGGTPEPWADRAGAVAALTADQRALLAGLDDQPAPPRLDGLALGATGHGRGAGPGAGRNDDDGHDADDPHHPDQPAVPHLRASGPGHPGAHTGNGTGNAPGDPGPGRSYRRPRWNRREQER